MSVVIELAEVVEALETQSEESRAYLDPETQHVIRVHELAGGEVRVWAQDRGPIVLSAVTPHGDPVELSADEAVELAEELLWLARETS